MLWLGEKHFLVIEKKLLKLQDVPTIWMGFSRDNLGMGKEALSELDY